MKADLTVNDVHSELNETIVSEIYSPSTIEELQSIIKYAKEQNKVICICGGRHAMGSQQFAQDGILVDTRKLKKVLNFDTEKGLIEVEAGIEWPELVEYIRSSNNQTEKKWSIIQKQTGADKLTLGGSLSANVHGRGLKLKPIIEDVEFFSLINSNGEQIRCSRTENYELFKLAIGGYGLLGIIATVGLRLTPAIKLIRKVEVISIDDLSKAFENRIKEGFLYGDFQFDTDTTSDDFLTKGVFSCYGPTSEDVKESTSTHLRLSAEQWQKLYELGHTDQKKAFEVYSKYYLSTSGQIYDIDLHQMSYYLEGYHHHIDQITGEHVQASEMITEIYVSRDQIATFMKEVAAYFKKSKVNIFYGTIRLIEKDDECFLAWAKKPYICIIFNLHVTHTDEGIENAKRAFCDLIDMARHMGGSYYLTYHKWASREQVDDCYPQLKEFLDLKKKHDPDELFQSEWYRHYKKMYS